MRALAGLAALVILGACGSESAPAQNKQERASPPSKARAAPRAEPSANAAAPDDPALAQMSPSRRRAYDRGLADCRAGRYDPDPYPEAYRIGCAAANDR
jgi:hypothetical protein